MHFTGAHQHFQSKAHVISVHLMISLYTVVMFCHADTKNQAVTCYSSTQLPFSSPSAALHQPHTWDTPTYRPLQTESPQPKQNVEIASQ